MLGWQAGTASGCFLAGTEIQALIILDNPGYVPQRWHGVLLAISLVWVACFINTVLSKVQPTIQATVLFLHVFGFLAIINPLWFLSPHPPAERVFREFNDGGDWKSPGLATLVGILSPFVSLIGPDAAVHISEEVRNASKTIPRIMLATAIGNGTLGFVTLLTLCFCIGDLDELLETPTGYPFIQVSRLSSQSSSSRLQDGR